MSSLSFKGEKKTMQNTNFLLTVSCYDVLKEDYLKEMLKMRRKNHWIVFFKTKFSIMHLGYLEKSKTTEFYFFFNQNISYSIKQNKNWLLRILGSPIKFTLFIILHFNSDQKILNQ